VDGNVSVSIVSCSRRLRAKAGLFGAILPRFIHSIFSSSEMLRWGSIIVNNVDILHRICQRAKEVGAL